MLSDRIREQRKKTNFTQDSLGKLLGVSQQTIGSWESGRTSPDKESLKLLADVFNCSVDWLLNKTLEDFRSLLLRIMEEQSIDSHKLSSLLHVSQKTVDEILDDTTSMTNTEFNNLINFILAHSRDENKDHLVNQYFFDITPFAADQSQRKLKGPYLPYKRQPYPVQVKIIGSVKAGPDGIALTEPLGVHHVVDDSLPSGTPMYFLVVRGDSMCPYLLPDDLVLFCENPDVPSGSLAIVIVDGEDGTIKWLKRGDGYVRLEAENPYYPTREFQGVELSNIRIVGPVLEIIRKPSRKTGFISK